MSHDSRVLLFSPRELPPRGVWNGCLFEFEEVIRDVESVTVLAPGLRTMGPWARRRAQLQEVIGRRFGFPPESRPEDRAVEASYDLFVALLHFPFQARYLESIKGWRSRCRTAVCVIVEQWSTAHDRKGWDALRDFDQIFVGSRWSLPAMGAATGRPCDYLPLAVDAERLCPYPNPPARVIDVYSMGRRSEATHRALRTMMSAGQLTYLFDSVSAGADPTADLGDHRALLAHLIKRSRYFIAYRYNDTPGALARTAGEEAIPLRFFEGAAGGAILLGTAPQCDDYETCFDWPDALIPIPYEAPHIAQVLAELDAQPDRLARARRSNVVNSLRRHDWVYRWGTILEAAKLPRSASMDARMERLRRLAELADQQAEPIEDS